MRKLIYILSGLFLFTLTGCGYIMKGSPGEIEVPSLKVVHDNESISVEKGGYQWTKNLGLFQKQSVIADSASPDQISETMEGDEVPPQSELKLNFSEKPNKVTVADWSISKDSAHTFKDNTLILPKENGTYIYEIIGYWDEGQVSYTIKIIVNS